MIDLVSFAADIAGPQAFPRIAFAFVRAAPASLAVVAVDSSERPRFFLFPSNDSDAISPSCAATGGMGFVHSATDARTRCGPGSIVASPGLRHNKNWEHFHNKPSLHHNDVSGTSDLPMDATTSHPRKTIPPLYEGRHKHLPYPATRLHTAVLQKRRAVEAERLQVVKIS